MRDSSHQKVGKSTLDDTRTSTFSQSLSTQYPDEPIFPVFDKKLYPLLCLHCIYQAIPELMYEAPTKPKKNQFSFDGIIMPAVSPEMLIDGVTNLLIDAIKRFGIFAYKVSLEEQAHFNSIEAMLKWMNETILPRFPELQVVVPPGHYHSSIFCILAAPDFLNPLQIDDPADYIRRAWKNERPDEYGLQFCPEWVQAIWK